ncbi:LysR family transcriptional regulator [Glutamicibacter halophytocola]|uniref:LysR family transcriptional regulator n=1 Tax=Glutamicibacter halophytocola TaxID=1933880 RepID=UPI00321B3D46
MIDPRLSTLRVFSSTGNVARTAELTGYSPSAVSAQLRELRPRPGDPAADQGRAGGCG